MTDTPSQTNLPTKPPLDRETLREVNELALWAGQMLLQHGAETERIERSVHRIGTALGCDWLDVLVSPNGVMVTTSSGGEFRTRLRRVVHIGVNMAVLDEISHLTHRIERGQLHLPDVRPELERISRMGSQYNRWLIALVVGLACAAFSQLAGGDTAAFFITLAASGTAMAARQEMTRRHFNLILTVAVTAFVAGLIASAGAVLRLTATPDDALASSVLLLVPGVPLINAAEDLIKGHMVTGIVRGLTGVLISLAIALGLLLAMRLMGAGTL